MASDELAAGDGDVDESTLALVPIALWAAALLPGLIAYNVPPSPTLFNQAAALGLWGAAAVALAPACAGNWRAAWARAAALHIALLLVAAAALLSSLVGGLPWSLGLSAVGLLAATMGLLLVGTGVASSGIAIVQVFAPHLADGEWIARSGLAGRAVGNLRQPNHLASLLLWSAVAVVPLVELGALARTRLRDPSHKLVCQAARSRLDLV